MDKELLKTAFFALPTLYLTFNLALLLHRLLYSPIRRIPGPFYTLISSILCKNLVFGPKTHLSIVSLHKKYGPVVRLDPNTVSIVAVEDVRQVYSSNKFLKGTFYDAIGPVTTNVFTTRDPVQHQQRRKLISHVFNIQSIRAQEPLILEGGIFPLLSKLDKLAQLNRDIDVIQEFQRYTFDVIGELSFGKSFNSMNLEKHPLAEYTLKLQKTIRWIVLFPFIKFHAPFLYPEYKNTLDTIMNYCRQVIINRRKEGPTGKNSRVDTLQLILDAVDDETGKGLSQEEVVSEMLVHLLAGTETVAITLTWTMELLLQNPECYEKLEKEILENISPDPWKLSQAELNKLPYLDAVFHESMRYRPAVSIPLPRLVPKGGCYLSGHFVPEGTTVACSAYVVHHTCYDNPEQFNPDRWINATPEDHADLLKLFLPFSTGPRSCLGRNLAWTELKMALAAIIQRYRIEKGKEYVENNSTVISPLLRPSVPVYVKLVKRPNAGELPRV